MQIVKGFLCAALLGACSISHADMVEITLADDLDGILNGYCLDIARGQKEDADPANGLQAHTCYSHEGQLAIDQIFDTDKFDEQVLYMPEFDVCATLTGLEAGAALALASCDGSNLQQLVMSDTGQITPVEAPTLCVTAALETTSGRSKTNLMRSLSLQECNDEEALYQTWRTRLEDD